MRFNTYGKTIKLAIAAGLVVLSAIVAGVIVGANSVPPTVAEKLIHNTTPATATPAGTMTTPAFKNLSPGTKWQWQLTGKVDETILDKVKSDRKMIDIDMETTDKATIGRLKQKGITVVCYVSVGSWEKYRTDAQQFPASVKGKPLKAPYKDERYLDIRSPKVKQLIVQRFNVAKQKGCEGIEPDIDDVYFEDFRGNYQKVSKVSGFPIHYKDQLAYNRALAQAAHGRGMSFGLKNGADARFVRDMLPYADWVLTEECFKYKECEVYKPFINEGKAVFHVEYSASTAAFCPVTKKLKFDSLKKSADLGAKPRVTCPK